MIIDLLRNMMIQREILLRIYIIYTVMSYFYLCIFSFSVKYSVSCTATLDKLLTQVKSRQDHQDLDDHFIPFQYLRKFWFCIYNFQLGFQRNLQKSFLCMKPNQTQCACILRFHLDSIIYFCGYQKPNSRYVQSSNTFLGFHEYRLINFYSLVSLHLHHKDYLQCSGFQGKAFMNLLLLKVFKVDGCILR